MARTKLIYTYEKEGKHYIVDRQTFIKILSEEIYCDTDYSLGWCGVSSANYKEGTSKANWLARTGTCLLCDEYSFRVFKEEQFQRQLKAFGDKYTDLRGKK